MKPFLISVITKFKACSLGAQAAIWCGSVALTAGAISVPVIIANTNKVDEPTSQITEITPDTPIEDMGKGGDDEDEEEPTPEPETPKEEVKTEEPVTPTPTPTPQTKPTTSQNTNCPDGCTPVPHKTPLPKVGEPNYYEERCYLKSDNSFLCYFEDNLSKEELEAYWMMNYGANYLPPSQRPVYHADPNTIY